MTNKTIPEIESIAQAMIDDPIHYVDSLSAMANSHELSAAEDIVSSSGIKLIARGTRIDGSLREKLFKHRLAGPTLDRRLSVAGSVTPESLASAIGRLIDEDRWLKQLALKSGDANALRHGLARVALPREILFRLTVAREQRPDLFQHSLSVTLISHYLALGLKLHPRAIDQVLVAALCHDLGELYTDPAILSPGHRISDEERRFIYVHPITGWLIVRDIQGLDPEVARAVNQHQERLDGSGYPNGKKGEDIGVAGRILAAADISASIMARFKDHRRLSTLLRLNGTKYDRKIIDLLLEAVLQTNPAPAHYVEEDSRQCMASFARLIAGWSSLRADATAAATAPVVFLADRIYSIRTVVAASGFDPDSLDTALELAAEDATIAAELIAVIHELRYQLVELEREIDRLAPLWPTTLDPATRVALDQWRQQLRECSHE